MSLLVFTLPNGLFDGIGTLHLKTLQLQCSAHNLPAMPSKTICHDWLATNFRKKLQQTYLLSFAKAEWPPAMRDGSRSPRLSWGLLKKDVGWLGVIWAEIDWRWVVPWGFDAQPSHRHRMCMLNTHPSPPSHALAKQVCWLCSHHVCLMFTSKSFSVTPSIFVSRGAPSRLQSTAEGVACATQRATWRGWRLRGPTATLARALGGQWQMPWLQGLVETSWNEIPQIGWPNMTRKGQCIYKAAKRKGNLWWVAHMVPALLSCCWNRSTIYFTKQMTIKPKIYELPHIATVSTAKQKKKLLNCPCNVWLATFVFISAHVFQINLTSDAEGWESSAGRSCRSPPSVGLGGTSATGKSTSAGRRVGQIWSGLWIVCWSIKGIEMYIE